MGEMGRSYQPIGRGHPQRWTVGHDVGRELCPWNRGVSKVSNVSNVREDSKVKRGGSDKEVRRWMSNVGLPVPNTGDGWRAPGVVARPRRRQYGPPTGTRGSGGCGASVGTANMRRR
jgi:hypothetical protein